jgi:hypothetical protein
VAMTHDELLEKIKREEDYLKTYAEGYGFVVTDALRAVVELHSPFDGYCQRCTVNNWGELRQEYPCDEIQAIEKELG